MSKFAVLALAFFSLGFTSPTPENLSDIAGRIRGADYSGTAFVYQGHLVTAGHICDYWSEEGSGDPLILSVVRDNREVFAGLYEPEKWVYDGAEDACVLKSVLPINSGLRNLIPPLGTPNVGDAVSIVGAPWGYALFRTDGYIANLNLFGGFIATSAAAAGGNSGSPVVDSLGNVIGILTAGLRAYDHVSLVTPISVLDKLLAE